MAQQTVCIFIDTYTYDAVGNRLSRSRSSATTVVSDYLYEATSNRLTSVTTGALTRLFSYDQAGNTVLDKHGTGRKDPANDYAYNADGRMSEAASINGGSAAYTYDDFGRQVQGANDTGTLQMAYGLDGALLEETDVSAGGTLRSYIRLNALDAGLLKRELFGGTPAPVIAGIRSAAGQFPLRL